MTQSTGGFVIQRIEDWLREHAIRRAYKRAMQAFKAGDKDAMRTHARRMLAEMKARSPEQVARLDVADLKRLRAMRR